MDSNKQITHLYNSISPDKKSFIYNTWYNFDKQGNLYKPLSFYYDTYMRQSKDKDSSFITYDALFTLHDGEHYAIVGDYDEYFELQPNSKVDTFWMRSDEPVIMIPVDASNMKKGRHNIRFVVHEDKRINDTITRKRTFVDRDYYIEHERE